jgi:hypothetical protein
MRHSRAVVFTVKIASKNSSDRESLKTGARLLQSKTVSVSARSNIKGENMNYLSRLSLSFIGLAFLTQILFVAPVAAQNVRQQERERLSKIMNPAADVEEFRQEFANYLTEMEGAMRLFGEIKAVREQWNRSGLRPIEMFVQAKRRVSEMSAEDLTAMRAAYAKVSRWRDVPENIKSLLKPEFRQKLEIRLANKGGGGATAEVDDNCADGINANISNTDIAIAEAFRIAAEAAQDVIPAPFNFIAVAATAATKGVTLALQTLKNIKDDCQGDEFEAAIQNQVATSTTTITTAISSAQTTIVNNDNANTTTIVNNDNTNKDTIVNNDNANTAALTLLINTVRTQIIDNANANRDFLKNLILRTQIEADLASTDGSVFVALYETPSSVCTPSAATPPTQCGLLDLVRTIVRETIANVGAGTNAQSFFDAGDAHRAAGRFKQAYASYRQAYKAASK